MPKPIPCKHGEPSHRRCAECRYACTRKWREQNPRSAVARVKAWRIANREKFLAARREYWQRNAEKLNAARRGKHKPSARAAPMSAKDLKAAGLCMDDFL